ncbi:DUF6412 domain-containing protein [Curtobacterium luteum]|uniref:Uncharacterized protein n=1 Tax=Curtobacterium luteum TaxID=33881 RepID=A0A175RHY1_9MICO|nr:DUF6412 domain-containing protein [Curtobacterium luteum]KTR02903.1 hypothetical protein NS184_14885 [Curtobacterium luteum]
MVVVEFLLRLVAVLSAGAPVATGASDLLPAVVATALGGAAAVALVVLTTVAAAVLGLRPHDGGVDHAAWAVLRTEIASSHPDADGHARPRAPGVVAPV